MWRVTIECQQHPRVRDQKKCKVNGFKPNFFVASTGYRDCHSTACDYRSDQRRQTPVFFPDCSCGMLRLHAGLSNKSFSQRPDRLRDSLHLWKFPPTELAIHTYIGSDRLSELLTTES